MKKYIFGNMKMNMTLKDIETYIEKFLPLVSASKNEVAIFPSFVNLMFAKQKLTASKVLLGAQNVYSVGPEFVDIIPVDYDAVARQWRGDVHPSANGVKLLVLKSVGVDGEVYVDLRGVRIFGFAIA